MNIEQASQTAVSLYFLSHSKISTNGHKSVIEEKEKHQKKSGGNGNSYEQSKQ